MQCHVIYLVLDTTGTTQTFYEIEKFEGNKEKQIQRSKTQRKKRRNKLSFPSPGEVVDT